MTQVESAVEAMDNVTFRQGQQRPHHWLIRDVRLPPAKRVRPTLIFYMRRKGEPPRRPDRISARIRLALWECVRRTAADGWMRWESKPTAGVRPRRFQPRKSAEINAASARA